MYFPPLHLLPLIRLKTIYSRLEEERLALEREELDRAREALDREAAHTDAPVLVVPTLYACFLVC